MDLIDRQGVIDHLRSITVATSIGNKYNEGFVDGLDFAVEHLKTMPSVQPEPQWIPVTERLPEKPNMYTVTDSKGDVVRFVYTATKSSREYWKRCAKAWMPLPEPYKENEYEEKNNKTN